MSYPLHPDDHRHGLNDLLESTHKALQESIKELEDENESLKERIAELETTGTEPSPIRLKDIMPLLRCNGPIRVYSRGGYYLGYYNLAGAFIKDYDIQDDLELYDGTEIDCINAVGNTISIKLK